MTFTNQGLISLCLRIFTGAVAVLAVKFSRDPSYLVLPIVATFFLWSLVYKLDVTNIWIAFALPWLLILGYSAMDLSVYSRPIGGDTILSIVLVISIGLIILPCNGIHTPLLNNYQITVKDSRFKLLLTFYIFFCLLNVLLAGYIPLLRGIMSGDTGYMDFGVKGLYGFFNAFANAFGISSFYFWLNNPQRRLYKWTYFLVLSVFFVFVTRQNMISLLIESFIVYSFLIKKIPGIRLTVIFSVVLVIFSLIGDMRVGADIAEIAKIKEDYLWIPRAFIWLYAYFYFNILNLDNVVESIPHPAFDGSSVAGLLPSFLRPEFQGAEELLEVSSFTVNSFISPIFFDVGFLGLAIFFVFYCSLAWFYWNKLLEKPNFLGCLGYSVLYFCFLFSFFVNFWFYLPVIFQLFFLWFFCKFLLIEDYSSNVDFTT